MRPRFPCRRRPGLPSRPVAPACPSRCAIGRPPAARRVYWRLGAWLVPSHRLCLRCGAIAAARGAHRCPHPQLRQARACAPANSRPTSSRHRPVHGGGAPLRRRRCAASRQSLPRHRSGSNAAKLVAKPVPPPHRPAIEKTNRGTAARPGPAPKQSPRLHQQAMPPRRGWLAIARHSFAQRHSSPRLWPACGPKRPSPVRAARIGPVDQRRQMMRRRSAVQSLAWRWQRSKSDMVLPCSAPALCSNEGGAARCWPVWPRRAQAQ